MWGEGKYGLVSSSMGGGAWEYGEGSSTIEGEWEIEWKNIERTKQERNWGRKANTTGEMGILEEMAIML